MISPAPARTVILVLSVFLAGMAAVGAAPASGPAVPRLPATPERAVAMLNRFDDAAFKAILAQPGLKGRVETLMALSGCDWSIDRNAARQATTRSAAAYLNSMEDEDLRDALTDSAISDRIDLAFKRDQCVVQDNPATAYPPVQSPDPYADPRYPYPYGYRPDPGYGYPADPRYGGYGPGYGGYGPNFPVPATPYGGGYGPGYPVR